MAERPPKDANQGRSEPGQQRGQGDSGQEPSFGSFISDSVRRSAGQFRGDQPSRQRRSRTSRTRTGEQPRTRSSRFSGEQPRRARRPGERQRRSSTSAETAEPTERQTPPAPQPADWLQVAIDRIGGPQRALIALAAGVVVLIALIWLVTSMLGGEDGADDPTPTETLQVLPIGGEASPEAIDGDGAPTAPEPTRSVIPTLPPVDLTGGSDNALDQDDGAPDDTDGG